MQTTEKYKTEYGQFSLIILTFSIKTEGEDFIGEKQTKSIIFTSHSLGLTK